MRSSDKLIVLVVCILALAANAAAQGTCSLQTVQGTYAIAANGSFGPIPYNALGVVKVEATGTTLAKVTVVTPFASWDQTSGGAMAVSPDCRATVTYPDFTEEMLILKNSEEIRALLVDPVVIDLGPPVGIVPRVQSGTGYRQSPGSNNVSNCSAGTFAGRYSQNCTGYIMVGPMTFLPLGFTGVITSDGKGSFTGGGTYIAAGLKYALTYKNGAYTIDSDCRGTATFEFEGMPGVWKERMVAFDQGKEGISITTSGQQVDMCRFTRMDR